MSTTNQDLGFFETLFESVAVDLAMIMDTELAIDGVSVERRPERAAGEDQIHISFKFQVQDGTDVHHGCALVPLPDAISLACYLMMTPEEEIAEMRSMETLDPSLKDAMIEISNFVAGATDAVVRTWYSAEATCRSSGCQGVRADVRPAFPYEEGAQLAVGRAQAKIASFPPFEMITMLPVPVTSG